MDAISPELALVDAELDSFAREALPDAPDCLHPHDHDERRLPTTRGRVSRRTLAALAGVVAVLAIVVLLVAWSPDGPAEMRPGVEKQEAASAPPHRHAPDRLRWKPIRGAAHYNVIFWRNGSRSLDLWPRTASVRVPTGRLAPGRYQWFVYPAFRENGKLRYGPVAARGSIRF